MLSRSDKLLTYDRLHGHGFNHLYFYGPVTKESVNIFNRSLAALERKLVFTFPGGQEVSFHADPVLLHINSFGGDASAIISAVRNMRDSKLQIFTIVDGVAFSAAADLLLAGERRFAFASSLVLLHQHAGPGLIKQRHEDNIAESEYSTAMYEKYRQFYLENSSLDPAALDRLLARDTFLTAPECKAFGLIDGLVLPVSRSPHRHKHLELDSLVERFYSHDRSGKLLDSRDLSSLSLEAASDWQGLCTLVQAVSQINQTLFSNILIPSSLSFSGIPRPLKLVISDIDHVSIGILLPLIASITSSIVPIVSIIEGNCHCDCVLLNLVCHERWMYHYSTLRIDLRYHQNVSDKLQDSVENSNVFRSLVMGIFKGRANLPQEMLSQIFEKAFVLNAKQALDFGIIDGILDDTRKNRRISSIQTPAIDVSVQQASLKTPAIEMKGGKKKSQARTCR